MVRKTRRSGPTERRLLDALIADDFKARQRQTPPRQPLVPRSAHCTTVRTVNAATGCVRVRPQRDKVLILGGGPTHVAAPLDDPSYEVWCCNDLAGICVDSEGRFRADRWFELHPKDPVVQWRRRPDFWRWLKTLPIPVYQFARRDNKQSLEFPLQKVIDAGRDYFGCTFAYQMGLAYLEGFTTVAMYGADLLAAREATVERATVEWWDGYIRGKGVTMIWPEDVFPREYPAIRAGHHPYRYGHPDSCEQERAAVYNWIRDEYLTTFPSFLRGNRPPQTIREWLSWY